jgi:hypothetical protein
VSLRQGEIYWIADCPPLHGKFAAPHAVVILNPSQQLKDPSQPIHAMVVSSSIPNPGAEHIAMPNKQTHQTCSTGFSRPCWAVSHWILRITDRSKLGSRSGHISGAILRSVVAAFAQVVEDGHMPIEHPQPV